MEKLKLYNTLTQKKEVFKPIKDKKVGIYTCGPTVYDFAHIGNLRAYVFADILKKVLLFDKYKVRHVMNITDIEDKLIKKSKGKKEELKKITKEYEKYFIEDLKKLNIDKADINPKATEHIKDMVELLKKLLKKRYAYKTSDGIYFSIKKFKNYGKLSKIKIKELKKGARVGQDEYDKESARDFALWKFWEKDDGDIFWETNIGKGRPGWHIECSAMSSKYLGEHFDIHTGGIDLVFPHHENEIAQSEAASGKKFVNYWLHNEWLFVNGKKMSKSLGNFFTLRDIVEKGFNPLVLRYIYLTAHYRNQLDFSLKNLENVKNAYEKLKNIIANFKDDKKINKEYLSKFEKVINDDLNMPKALQVLWKLVRDEKAEGKIETIKKMDSIFGLNLLEKEKVEIPKEIKKLVEKREAARKRKEWKKADEIREQIKKKDYIIEDTPEGPKIKKR